MFTRSRRCLFGVVGGAILASSVGFGTLWSYVRTAHQEVGEKLRDTIPISFELRRLEKMTGDLIPEIRTNQKVAAQLDVEIDYTKREIENMQVAQNESKAEMAKLRDALKEDKESYDFGGRSFSRADIERDLESRLTRYDNLAVQLQAKRQILAKRQTTLSAATRKISEHQLQYDALVQKAESLKGELKLVQLAEQAGTFDFNKSKLQQANDLSREVEKRIETLKRYVDGQRHVHGEIPVDIDASPITQRFDEYFAGKEDG